MGCFVSKPEQLEAQAPAAPVPTPCKPAAEQQPVQPVSNGKDFNHVSDAWLLRTILKILVGSHGLLLVLLPAPAGEAVM